MPAVCAVNKWSKQAWLYMSRLSCTMSNAQLPAPIKVKLRHRFYAAVVFLSAVTQAYTNNRQPSSNAAQWDGQPPPEATFRDFVNKLSQFCDVKPGGNSVTAFTILDCNDHFEYRFACNRRNKSLLTKVSDYITDLLQTLHHVQQDDRFRSLLLGKVLCFGRDRVHHYLGALTNACRACEVTNPADGTLREQLRHCLEAARQADFKTMPEDKCEFPPRSSIQYYKSWSHSNVARPSFQGSRYARL